MAPHVPRETLDRRPEHGPCDCNIDHDPVDHGASHRLAEHTSCWGWPPCGGCDSCLAAQAAYYAGLRTTVTGEGWDVHSTGKHGAEVRWRKDPAQALALAFTLGGTIVPANTSFPPVGWDALAVTP